MALTLIAHDWCKTRGINLCALTVDHGLRAESAAEAHQVASMMHEHGIAHAVLTPPPMPVIRNTQAQARARRYGALAAACRDMGCTHLLVAHHADDQAETVALQRHRGDTPSSRAGMALVSRRDGIHLVRPLLGTRKSALITYLRQRGQPWIEDPSNAQDRYARNRLRRCMTEGEFHSLWREAQHAGQARHRDETARNAFFSAQAKLQGGVLTWPLAPWAALPDTSRTDALGHAIRTIGGREFRPRHHETARLDAAILATPQGFATLGHCRIVWKETQLTVTHETLHRVGLEPTASTPYIRDTARWKLLVSEPFWWFNHPLAS